VLGEVALAAGGRVAPVGLGAVPGKEVLVGIQWAAEGAPVVPILLEGVDEVGFVVAAVAELEEVFFRKAAGDVELGPHSGFGVARLRTDETH